MRVTDHKGFIKALKDLGFECIRHKKHAIYEDEKGRKVSVPGGKKGFSRMYAQRILRELGVEDIN